MADTLHEYWNTGDLTEHQFFGTIWDGQTFTVGTNGTNEDHNIGSVKVKLFKAGNPGTITADIKLVSGGAITGSVLSTGTTSGNTLTTSTAGEWREISMSSYKLEASKEYALILHIGGNPWNSIKWKLDPATPSYTGGDYINSSDSGVNWDMEPWAGADFMFEIWGEAAAAPTYALTITAGANGSASDETGTSPYEEAVEVDILATPNALYMFKNWTTSDGGTFGNENIADTTYTMPGNVAEITANFELRPLKNYKAGGETMPKHDYKANPELTNAQLDTMYFESPHRQIVRGFEAEVVRVHDGDTITVRVPWRDFDFPIRFARIDARELSEGGKSSGEWLRQRIEGNKVYVGINFDNRVGKFGRLIGEVVFRGINMNDDLVRNGLATPFGRRREGLLPLINKEFNLKQWF